MDVAKPNSPDSPWLIDAEGSPSVGILLAHGSGAGMRHDYMTAMAKALAERGLRVVRFQFDYMNLAEATGKRRPPERMPKLCECFERHFDAVTKTFPDIDWFIGGKSMGGRVAAIMQPELRSLGVVCLGYPFHPPKKPDNLRQEPLQKLGNDGLIVQGTRDTLGNQDEVAGYSLPKDLSIQWLPDGDHDFKPRVRSGHTQAAHIEQAAAWVADFCLG